MTNRDVALTGKTEPGLVELGKVSEETLAVKRISNEPDSDEYLG